MKYKVVGANMYSGKDVELVVDATSRDSAMKKAARESVIIVTVDPAQDELHSGTLSTRKFSISDETGASVSPTIMTTWEPPSKAKWFNIIFPWRKIAGWLWRRIPRVVFVSAIVLYRWVWWQGRPTNMEHAIEYSIEKAVIGALWIVAAGFVSLTISAMAGRARRWWFPLFAWLLLAGSVYAALGATYGQEAIEPWRQWAIETVRDHIRQLTSE